MDFSTVFFIITQATIFMLGFFSGRVYEYVLDYIFEYKQKRSLEYNKERIRIARELKKERERIVLREKLARLDNQPERRRGRSRVRIF